FPLPSGMLVASAVALLAGMLVGMAAWWMVSGSERIASAAMWHALTAVVQFGTTAGLLIGLWRLGLIRASVIWAVGALGSIPHAVQAGVSLQVVRGEAQFLIAIVPLTFVTVLSFLFYRRAGAILLRPFIIAIIAATSPVLAASVYFAFASVNVPYDL